MPLLTEQNQVTTLRSGQSFGENLSITAGGASAPTEGSTLQLELSAYAKVRIEMSARCDNDYGMWFLTVTPVDLGGSAKQPIQRFFFPPEPAFDFLGFFGPVQGYNAYSEEFPCISWKRVRLTLAGKKLPWQNNDYTVQYNISVQAVGI